MPNLDEQLNECRGDSRKMWKILNKSTGFRKLHTGTTGVTNQTTANNFNNYFTGVSKEFHNDLKETIDTFRLTKPQNSTDDNSDTPLFELRVSTSDDVLKIINQLDPSKAVGHDQIGAMFFRSAANTLSNVISQLINSCITAGVFPTEHKIAKVSPLHKKGDHSEAENHRPVSILTTLSKIPERFIADRIVEHVEGNNLINLHQSGFRRKHGTNLAIHHMIDKWATALSQKKCE